MKALTICQPYASAIIEGPNRVENRQSMWRFRGRIVVHAGKSTKYLTTVTADERATWPGFSTLKITFGALLGTVEIYDCVPLDDAPQDDPWVCGPFCLLLRDPVAFPKPIPWRGQLGLFDVPDHVVGRLEA